MLVVSSCSSPSTSSTTKTTTLIKVLFSCDLPCSCFTAYIILNFVIQLRLCQLEFHALNKHCIVLLYCHGTSRPLIAVFVTTCVTWWLSVVQWSIVLGRAIEIGPVPGYE